MADPSTADVQAELKEYLNSKNINRYGPTAAKRAALESVYYYPVCT